MTPRDILATAQKTDSLGDIATVMMEKNIRHMFSTINIYNNNVIY